VAFVAGLDVYRAGWIAILVGDDAYAGSLTAPTFGQALAQLDDAAVIGVDIPIGLPSSGPREADLQAAAFVGPRRSSVFPAPAAGAVACATYAEARRLTPSLSAQSFALRTRILEVQAHLEGRIVEVHPEVSFAALAGAHLRFSKRSWNGQMERRRLLATAGIALPDELVGGEAGADDVLDAAVVAWTAGRILRGEASSLPAHPPVESGRRVAIWY
jgi:predicted RNase H-like nuclease